VANKSRRRSTSIQARPSQCARVYAELRTWYPQECPLEALLRLSPRVAGLTARLWELRHKCNLEIFNRVEHTNNEVHSFYQLTRDSAEAVSAFGYPSALPPIRRPISSGTQGKSASTQAQPDLKSELLFEDSYPESRYPD
jgi:hypothetical protein